MKCTQKYLDEGCFLEALGNLSKEMAFYLHKEETFLLDHIKRGDLVVDIGVGNGRASFYLARKVGLEGKVVGIDNNKSMLDIASKETRVFRNIEIYPYDAKKTPFDNNYFDTAVITFNTLGNLEESELYSILKESYRIVKPEGLILGTVYSKDAANAQKEQYEKIGLEVDHIDDNYVYVNEAEFKGERFSESKLRRILSEVSSSIDIERICDIAYGFKVEVRKNV